MTHAELGDSAQWRPIHVSEQDELARLFHDPDVEVFDKIDVQRKDLARLLPALDESHLNESTRWYYFPWRRSVVHLLGPSAFQTLRADRNRNKITTAEQQQLRELRVGVVGLSVGHAIAYTLALEGACGEIRMADFDEIDLSNLNRIPGTVFDLGVNKAVVAARRIAELDPYIDVRIDPRGVSHETIDEFMLGLDVVIEECDSFDVKVAVRQAARRHRIPLIMETNDRGLLDVERYDLEPHRPLFHGLLGDVNVGELMGLSARDKVPYVLRILEPAQLSARVVASMTEIDETVSTWPQLGGDVQLGAATVATAVRHLGLGIPLPSGRMRVDLQEMLAQITDPPVPSPVPVPEARDVAPEPPPTEPLSAVVHAAGLAPSGGNVQPWTFIVGNSRLEIYLDPARTSTLDVAFRASYVSLGAALFNARIAAAHHGVLGAPRIFPNGSSQPPIAILELGDGQDATLAELYEPMLRRASNRHPAASTPLPDVAADVLMRAAQAEDAQAHVITEPSLIGELAELLGESDRIRFLTPRLHADLIRELRWPGVHNLDWGLDVRTLELDAADLAKLEVAQRADVMDVLAEQDLGHALGAMSRERLRGAPALAVVTIETPDPRSYIQAGQAVERVWIEMERLGLGVQVMSPVFIYAVDQGDYETLSPRYADQLRTLHRTFNDLARIGNSHIALTLRIGYAPPISVRSRRQHPERGSRAV